MAAIELDSGIGFEEVERGREIDIGVGIGSPMRGGGFGTVTNGLRSRFPIRVFKGGGGEGGGDIDASDDSGGLEDAVDGDDGDSRLGAKNALRGLDSRVGGGVCSNNRFRSDTDTCATGVAGLSCEIWLSHGLDWRWRYAVLSVGN